MVYWEKRNFSWREPTNSCCSCKANKSRNSWVFVQQLGLSTDFWLQQCPGYQTLDTRLVERIHWRCCIVCSELKQSIILQFRQQFLGQFYHQFCLGSVYPWIMHLVHCGHSTCYHN